MVVRGVCVGGMGGGGVCLHLLLELRNECGPDEARAHDGERQRQRG